MIVARSLSGDTPEVADPWDDAGRLQRIKAQEDATQGESYFLGGGGDALQAPRGGAGGATPGGEGCSASRRPRPPP